MLHLRHAWLLLLVPGASCGLFGDSAAWLQTCLSLSSPSAPSCSPSLAAAASFWHLSLNQQVQAESAAQQKTKSWLRKPATADADAPTCS